MTNDTTHRHSNSVIAGGVLGGAVGVAGAYNVLSNQFIRQIHHPIFSSKGIRILFDELRRGADTDHIETLIHQTQGRAESAEPVPKPVQDMFDVVDGWEAEKHSVETSEKFLKGQHALTRTPRYQQAVEAREGLELLRNAPEDVIGVEHVHTGATPMTVIREARSPMMLNEANELVHLPSVVKEYRIPNLAAPTVVTDIEKLASSPWMADAEKAVQQAEHALAEDYIKLFKKAAPTGWSWKRMPEESRIGVVTAGIFCGVVGALTAHLLTRGSHKKQVESQRQAAATDNSTPFAGL